MAHPEPHLAPTLLIDGVFFQIGRSGIARVWTQIFQHWLDMGLADRFVVVDRQRTLPRLPGMLVMDAPAFQYSDLAADQRLLQSACDAVQAEVFISTYYTAPLHTPTLMMVHDMIPEVLGWDLREPMWRQKQASLRSAQAFVTVSHNTARDLRQHLGEAQGAPITVCRPGCDFQPASAQATAELRERLQLGPSYFMLSGTRTGYKNAALFFEAFAQLGDARAQHTVLCTGGGALEPDFQELLGPARAQVAILSDAEMQAAYTGATALVYPSTYEGFGLPVLEAMACGCPVITSQAASLPEVGGPAPLYLTLDAHAPEQLLGHLHTVQEAAPRARMVQAGLAQAQRFSWRTMAEGVVAAASALAQRMASLRLAPTDQLWHGAGQPVALPAGHAGALHHSLHKLYGRWLPCLAQTLPEGQWVVDASEHHGEHLAQIATVRPDLAQLHCPTTPQALRYLRHNAALQAAQAVALSPSPIQVQPWPPQAEATPGPLGLMCLPNWHSTTLAAVAPLLERDHPVLALSCRAPAPQAAPDAFMQALRQLGELGYAHLWALDNHGNPVLMDTTPQAIDQLMAHIARQDHHGVSRTMYHLDVLAAWPEQAASVTRALSAHLQALSAPQ